MNPPFSLVFPLHSNLPPSLNPSRSSNQTSSTVPSTSLNASLSDYSDYTSSDEEDQSPSRIQRNETGQSQTSENQGLGWRAQDGDQEGDDDDGWELKYGSRIPEIGPAHHFIDAGDDDPFADPGDADDDESNGNMFGRGNQGSRQEYAAV